MRFSRMWSRQLLFFRACFVHLGFCVSAAVAEEEPLWNVAWITDTQTPACEWVRLLTSRVQAGECEMVIYTGDTRFEWANRRAWEAVMGL